MPVAQPGWFWFYIAVYIASDSQLHFGLGALTSRIVATISVWECSSVLIIILQHPAVNAWSALCRSARGVSAPGSCFEMSVGTGILHSFVGSRGAWWATALSGLFCANQVCSLSLHRTSVTAAATLVAAKRWNRPLSRGGGLVVWVCWCQWRLWALRTSCNLLGPSWACWGWHSSWF